MAKYVIEIPYEVKWIQYIQQTGHGTINLKVESVSDLIPYAEPDRQVIEDEVWDFVSRLIWSFVDREILGMDIALAVRDMTYQEAKEKYESWRKQKDEIHEYDEIISEVSDNKATIVRIDGWGRWHCINADGSFMVEINQQDCWKKTGRSFPELGDVLKKMREE